MYSGEIKIYFFNLCILNNFFYVKLNKFVFLLYKLHVYYSYVFLKTINEKYKTRPI